jgi:hypothetical protein
MAMLEQLNDHPVGRPDICKASAGNLPWLCENLNTALANGFHGLVHILNVQTEVSDSISVVVNPISIRHRNARLGALRIRCKN